MEIKEHNLNEIKVAEVLSDEIIIQNTADALDLMGNLYYQGFNKIIIYQKNITPDFFDLKNKGRRHTSKVFYLSYAHSYYW